MAMTTVRKPLGVRATPAPMPDAAARESRALRNFNLALQAARKAAEGHTPPSPKFSAEETVARIHKAQELFRQSGLHGRDLVVELLDERRSEVESESR